MWTGRWGSWPQCFLAAGSSRKGQWAELRTSLLAPGPARCPSAACQDGGICWHVVGKISLGHFGLDSWKLQKTWLPGSLVLCCLVASLQHDQDDPTPPHSHVLGRCCP